MRNLNFAHRMLFAALITYIATQAHGWAGGYATKPIVTFSVWLVVSAVSVWTQNRNALLALAVVTQLGIHFGTLGSHTHHNMQMSVTQMAYAHIVAGVLAWLLLVFSERAYILGSRALRFVIARIEILLTTLDTEVRRNRVVLIDVSALHTLFLNHVLIRRGPPVFSSN